jgi:hypothetical protein
MVAITMTREVSVPPGGWARTGIVHRVAALDRRDITVVDGIVVTTVARTLADLGSVVPVAMVRQALDDAWRRGISIGWLRDTAVRLHRPGQRGTGVLLALLDEASREGGVPESWLERLVERLVMVDGMPPLVRQHVIRDEGGRFVARVDLAAPAIRLAIEAHSRRFHFGTGPQSRDEDRDLRLAALGWEVRYLGYQHTRRADDVVPLVLGAVKHRKLQLSVPGRAS